jgi:hypothetical protein
VDVLADQSKSESEVSSTVKDLGEKGGASDGLESDAEGRVYLSDYEHNAIRRHNVNGEIETIVHDPRAVAGYFVSGGERVSLCDCEPGGAAGGFSWRSGLAPETLCTFSCEGGWDKNSELVNFCLSGCFSRPQAVV